MPVRACLATSGKWESIEHKTEIKTCNLEFPAMDGKVDRPRTLEKF
jgi:hypothetical protein